MTGKGRVCEEEKMRGLAARGMLKAGYTIRSIYDKIKPYVYS